MGKQSNLEKKGIDARHDSIVRNDYNINDEYNGNHSDALSNGDPQGKGTGSAGHSHYLPNYNLPQTLFNYSNVDTTTAAGGKYDIEGRNGIGGRNFLSTINIYNSENQYGYESVDTTLNQQDGQVVF